MAVIKFQRVKNLIHNQNLARYVREGYEVITDNDCDAERFVQNFQTISNHHDGKGCVQAYHIVQSWNEEESKQLTSEICNNIGRELAEGCFKGHAYVVVTHANRPNMHNHIIVNPWNSDTGEKLENKKYHIFKLKDLNDKLCRERGLSVPERGAKEKGANLPDKVWEMERSGGRSYLIDLVNKADLARSWSISYDEYVAYLYGFGVTVGVENKNIVYFVPGRERGKRGSSLGRNYDKEGLEKAFEFNDLRFKQVPGLRDQIRGYIDSFKDKKLTLTETKDALINQSRGTYEPGIKDYSKFTYIKRRDQNKFPHELDVNNSIIPIDEILKARRGNIFDYCKLNGIKLKKNGKGETILAGREYVTISEREWINNKNRTKGTLIEFIAAYKNKTFLQAISEINKNPKLLLLEKHFGEQKSRFISFYIPSEKRMDLSKAKNHLSAFLKNHGIDGNAGEKLLASNRVQVDKSGVIRFLSEHDKDGAIDFTLSGNNKWTKKTQGLIKAPFFSFKGFGAKANVFIDPLCFVKQRGKDPFKTSDLREPTICLMEPDDKPLDIFISSNRNISKIRFIFQDDHKKANHELDFITKVKEKYKPLGIEIEQGGMEKSLPERDLEIPFF